VQRFADATVWPHLAGGCHLARDTRAAITAAGFEITADRLVNFPPGPAALLLPHVLGTARRV
ncbi:MAG TPA: SAM-dependent methyltransferase, partial [Solirubrobacterales bacterium]|nr:SAM-dependent methyltransferase [Solirubrobacterales bacterium]